MPLLVGLVTKCEEITQGNNLKFILVNIGTDGEVSIVTNAPNIQEGSRTVIATIGTELSIGGELIEVKKTKVGGKTSQGIVCDSKMCGWIGGGNGIAVQIPESFELGSICPGKKPRGEGFGDEEVKTELSLKEKKELEKAEKKKAAKEKRELKKSLKEAS